MRQEAKSKKSHLTVDIELTESILDLGFMDFHAQKVMSAIHNLKSQI
jgi:hypothetical protein